MFAELLAEYVEWPAAALDDEVRRLELAARELDARRLAARAAEFTNADADDHIRHGLAHLETVRQRLRHLAA